MFGGCCWLQCAEAQTLPANPTAIKPSFIQPQLVEGGGQAGLVRAIQLKVVYPRAAQRNGIQGQNRVTFAVAPDGQIGRVRIIRSAGPDLDSATLQAVRQLPRLVPGSQFGKPVACLMSAPVTFYLTPFAISKKTLPAADSTQLYKELSQMPLYQGKLGYSKLAADLSAEYLRLVGNTDCFIPRNNLGLLITVGPRGNIYDVQIPKNEADEVAALRAEYGEAIAIREEDELPEACVGLLNQAAQRLSPLIPAYADGKRVATRIQITLMAPKN